MKSIKYRPVMFCVNCLNNTSQCNCPATLVAIAEECGNCREPLYEDWAFCAQCGFEIDSPTNDKEKEEE